MGLTPAEKQRRYRERRRARDREALAVLRRLAAEAEDRAERDGGRALRRVVVKLPSSPRALYWRGVRDGLRDALEVMEDGSDRERAERLAERCGLDVELVRGMTTAARRVLRVRTPGVKGR